MNYFSIEFVGMVRPRKSGISRMPAEAEGAPALNVTPPPVGHGRVTSDPVAMDALVARVRAIAELTPVEFAEKMTDAETSAIGRLEVDPELNPRSLLKSWDKIGRASSAPLSASAYARFVDGQHPTADEEELYGSKLRPNPTW